MRTVSRFEANLLRILQGLFGPATTERVQRLVEKEFDRPPCLSRNAMELVEDTLRKGVPQYLARQGGWRRERFLRNGKIAEGRIWNRRPPERLGLPFSEQSVKFLIWITANKPENLRENFTPEESRLSTGDRFLSYLAARSLRGTEAFRELMRQPPFNNHPLIWLMGFAELIEMRIKLPKSWDFATWFSGPGSSVLESLQVPLAEEWLKLEKKKTRIRQPELMRRFGTRQRKLLLQLFDAAEAADRRDLCRFFLIAMKRFLQSADREAPLYQMDFKGLRLAERLETYQLAAASLSQVERLDRWNREARSTGFYDDGYAAAQLWKSDWENLEGDRVVAEAGARLNALERSVERDPTSNRPKENANQRENPAST